MRRWTHIAGTIRIDAMPSRDDSLWMNEISKKLGHIVEFESPDEMWDLPEHQITPMGSEGGVEYFMTVTAGADSTSICRGTVTIHADLRDFGGESGSLRILEWLNRLTTLKLCYIRQGIVIIHDEGWEGTCVLIYRDDKFYKLDYDPRLL